LRGDELRFGGGEDARASGVASWPGKYGRPALRVRENFAVRTATSRFVEIFGPEGAAKARAEFLELENFAGVWFSWTAMERGNSALLSDSALTARFAGRA